MDSFSPYVERVNSGNAEDIETLLDCCSSFIHVCATSGKICIADSILPCWDWLHTAGCTKDQIAEFSRELCKLLAPLNPLLIFLNGDLNVSLARAIAERGEEWARALAKRRRNSDAIESLLDYFSEMRQSSMDMMDNWRFDKLLLDTTSDDISACEDTILRRLSL